MAMCARAVVRLGFDSTKARDVVFGALVPEVERHTSRRVNVMLVKDGSGLVLKVDAKDTVALRAALNSYLRWINSLMSVFDTIEEQC